MSSITVVIPSYHYGHLVAHALETVLGQTEPPQHVLVVDDAAGDCKHLALLYKEVEVLQRETNLGIVANFNDILFNHVKTERVMFLGADNWLHPQALELMGAREEDIIGCDARIVGNGENELWQLPYQPHGSALYSVEKARAVGGYAASGNKKTEEDSVLFKKMFDAGCSFYRVEEPLLYYRKHRWNFNGN